MDEETETKAIEKWLRMVDKPLAKKRETKRTRSQEKNEAIPVSRAAAKRKKKNPSLTTKRYSIASIYA